MLLNLIGRLRPPFFCVSFVQLDFQPSQLPYATTTCPDVQPSIARAPKPCRPRLWRWKFPGFSAEKASTALRLAQRIRIDWSGHGAGGLMDQHHRNHLSWHMLPARAHIFSSKCLGHVQVGDPLQVSLNMAKVPRAPRCGGCCNNVCDWDRVS